MTPEEEAIWREVHRATEAATSEEAVEILRPLQARVNRIKRLSPDFVEAMTGEIHIAAQLPIWNDAVRAVWPKLFRPGHPEFDELRMYYEAIYGRGFWRAYYPEEDA
jgi:hypothetical protein